VANRQPEVLLDPGLVDGHALGCVYAACVGVCWPDVPGKPNFREYRHDAVSFGEAFIGWALLKHAPGKRVSVVTDLADIGRELFGVLEGSLLGLFREAAETAGFTEEKEATGSS
jgi:hypothetical protein